jgi:hypothetical protein
MSVRWYFNEVCNGFGNKSKLSWNYIGFDANIKSSDSGVYITLKHTFQPYRIAHVSVHFNYCHIKLVDRYGNTRHYAPQFLESEGALTFLGSVPTRGTLANAQDGEIIGKLESVLADMIDQFADIQVW